MEGQDLQLDSQVNFSQIDICGHLDDARGESQNGPDSGSDQGVRGELRGRFRSGYHADRDSLPAAS